MKRQMPLPSNMRGYAAASNVARYGDFTASRGSADYELLNGLTETRAKIRFLARNSASMKRYIQLLQVNVVGDQGFRFQSRVKKLEGGLNFSLNERVEDAFAAWAERASACGCLSLWDLEHQAVETWARDGEVIWEIVTGQEYTDGVAINPVEADVLDETLNTIYGPTRNEIRMGVEINALGRPVAYHFLTSHPGDGTWTSPMLRSRYRRIPADRVIHLFKRQRPGQTRGEPPAAAIVLDVKMLDGYREAETTGRRLRSALMGFFESKLPDARGIDELSDGEGIDEDGDGQKDIFEMEMEPGLLKQLPRGVEFKEFSPGGMQGDYHQFESQVKKDISMGLGISTMSHGMEVQGVSYSSGRTVIQEDREFYKTLQQFFIRGIMRKLFPIWSSYHMVFSDGEPAFTPTQRPRILRRYIFRPRGWEWVDPSKDVSANAEALRTRQTSFSRVAAQRGIDRDELLREIAEDKEAAAALGLTIDVDNDTTQQTSEGDGNDDDE